jgi:hypothetical protein
MPSADKIFRSPMSDYLFRTESVKKAEVVVLGISLHSMFH